jgi:hypothetical protein
MSNDVSSPSGAEAARKRLVIVAGVGRSGTSLFTTILGMTGFHVPQPEVMADSTNPKGFGEPQWVVDFHGRNLRSRRVSVWDSRPSAWEDTARAAEDRNTFAELRSWLAVQFVGRDSVVVKDPRIGWFLPLWEKAATDLGVDVSFASLLRHPAEAVSSAIKWYGDWQSPASRTLSWVNVMLETEYATRDARRVFVRYDDLLADWSGEMARVGEALDIPVLREIPEPVRREVDAFVDPTLHRQKVTFADVGVPQQVEAMTEEIWKQFTALAVAGGDSPENRAVLDESRERYHTFYAEAEDIAQSTIHALRPKGGAGGHEKDAVARRSGPSGASAGSRGSGADAVIRVAERVVPPKLRRRVPPVWRSRIMRTANKAASIVRR